MTPIDTVRRAAGRALGPFALPIELWADGISDLARLLRGSVPGGELEEWDPDYIRRTLSSLRGALSVYFRPQVGGLENIPEDGPVLLVGNHSGGTLIADSFVLSAAFYRHFGPDRRFHGLTHDIAARMPGLAILRRYGAVRASHENARRAFELGAHVLVYPGGDWETFRPSWRSGEVDLAGRTGFIKLALDEGVPVVPVVAIGGQETALFVTRGERIAKLLMLDRLLRTRVLPVTIAPPFGISIFELPPRIPLPAQITLQVLPPIDLLEEFGSDADADEIYRTLEDRMQAALDELAEERDLPLVGRVGEPSSDGAESRDGSGGSAEAREPERREGEGREAPVAKEGARESEGDLTTASQEGADDDLVESPPTATRLPRTPRRASLPASERDGRGDGAAPADQDAVDAPPEEDALVAEIADREAADGAGAELHVDEPWEGYASMRVAEIAERVRGASPETLAAVRLYEQLHKGRRGVLTVVECELVRG